jgi:hypothetical protein
VRYCRKKLRSRAGHRQQYSACTLHAVYLSHKHCLGIRFTYCISTSSMIAQKRLYVMLCVYYHPCYNSETMCLLNGTKWIIKWISGKFLSLKNLSSIFSALAQLLYYWVNILLFFTAWWRKLTVTYWCSLLLHFRLSLFMMGDHV